MCSLESSHPGIIGKLAQDPVNAVAVLQQKDVPLMYWIRASWDKAMAAPDLYQLLAYATAAGCPMGCLVYAAGEGVPATHDITFADKILQVRSLELTGNIASLRSEVREIALFVDSLR